jgi:hypothetical protein
MQVLNKIIQKVDLPKEFIDSYIKHCIASYRQETKKDYKIRHARIIAIFVTNLIEHEHFYFDSIPHEVCISYLKLFNSWKNYASKIKNWKRSLFLHRD